jgi:hypothetical protein
MRLQMLALASTRPTPMIGLSGQDTNIQDIFAATPTIHEWHWPSSPPAFTCAEDAIGPHQRNILRVAYRDDYSPNSAAIEFSALLRAYAKPLLVALVLHVLVAKLEALARLSRAGGFPPTDVALLGDGLRQVRDLASAAADGDREAFIRAASAEMSRAMSLSGMARRIRHRQRTDP